MESYKEELFINETSHRFLSPPGSKGPIFQVGGLTRVDTVQLLFQNGLRLPLLFELRLTMCQTILHRGTQKEMIVFKHRNICRLDTMNESTIFSIKQSHRLFVVVKFNCKKRKEKRILH